MSKDVLTTNEAAEMLNCHPRTLYRWRRAKKGPPWSKVGEKVLYRRSAVLQWLQQQEKRYRNLPELVGAGIAGSQARARRENAAK